MTRPIPTRIALSASMVVLAQAASAQVTVTDVWESYDSWFSGMGLSVAARTEAAGGIMTVSDIVLGYELTLPVPSVSISVAVPYPDMVLIERAEGGVMVSTPPRFDGEVQAEVSIDFGFGPPERVALSLDLELRSENGRVLVTGTPDDMVFHTVARMMDFFVGNPRIIPVSSPDQFGQGGLDFDFTMGITIFDNEMTTRMRRVDGGTRLDFENHTGRTIINVSNSYTVDEWWSDEVWNFMSRDVSVAEATAASGSIFLPDTQPDLLDLSPFLRAGFEFEYVSSTVDQMLQSVTYENDTLFTEQDLRYGAIRQRLAMSEAGLAMTMGAADLAMRISDIELPWLVDISLEGVDFSMSLPLLASDEAQRAVFGLEIRDLRAADAIWAEVDPRVLLPRGPVSFEMDFGFLLDVREDLLAFERLAASVGTMATPVDLVGIEAETITFDGLGVKLDADGAISFPAGIAGGYYGGPLEALGQTRLDLSGVDALLDALVELDLIVPADAHGARVGLALIGKSTGMDSITSEVEFTEGGGIIINGQRMQ